MSKLMEDQDELFWSELTPRHHLYNQGRNVIETTRQQSRTYPMITPSWDLNDQCELSVPTSPRVSKPIPHNQGHVMNGQDRGMVFMPTPRVPNGQDQGMVFMPTPRVPNPTPRDQFYDHQVCQAAEVITPIESRNDPMICSSKFTINGQDVVQRQSTPRLSELTPRHHLYHLGHNAPEVTQKYDDNSMISTSMDRMTHNMWSEREILASLQQPAPVSEDGLIYHAAYLTPNIVQRQSVCSLNSYQKRKMDDTSGAQAMQDKSMKKSKDDKPAVVVSLGVKSKRRVQKRVYTFKDLMSTDDSDDDAKTIHPKTKMEELDKSNPGCSSVVTDKFNTMTLESTSENDVIAEIDETMSEFTPLKPDPAEETKCEFTSPMLGPEKEIMWMFISPTQDPDEETMCKSTPRTPEPENIEEIMYEVTPPTPEPENIEETMCEASPPTPEPENIKETMCGATPPTPESQKAEETMCEFTLPTPEPEKAAETKVVSLVEYFTIKQLKEHMSSLKHGCNQDEEDPCQLCGKNLLKFNPIPVYCSTCEARIKHGVPYYITKSNPRHCFCNKCYRKRELKVQEKTFSNADLTTNTNTMETEESWVQCSKCDLWQHQICGLFNKENDLDGKTNYTCPLCCLKELEAGERVQSTTMGAKDLPTTKLSDYIEKRLFRRLKKERHERRKVDRKNINEVVETSNIVVREVLSTDQQLKVKENFYNVVRDSNYPAELPYRSKVVLVFQTIDGADVCIFVMFVHEFSSDCQPNQRCVYISYVDSVKHFSPDIETVNGEALRTFVYHEIMIGYLEHCKRRGFATCYLWSCPPSEGDDFIFFCHPKDQKIPERAKLLKWYHSMLRKAEKEDIVVDCNNIYDRFFISNKESNSRVTASRLPYFDGVFWNDAAETFIKKIERLKGVALEKTLKRVMSAKDLKVTGHTSPPRSKDIKDILLMNELGNAMLPTKGDFMIINLQHVCAHCNNVILSRTRWSSKQSKRFHLCERCHSSYRRENISKGKSEINTFTQVVNDVPLKIEEDDATFDNDLFKSRVTFLSFCQERNYQFDTLRRAKHSTMMLLHNLLNN